MNLREEENHFISSCSTELLKIQVLAAEIHLTHFASSYGKGSEEYQSALRDFGIAWNLLRKNSRTGMVMPESQAG